MSQNTASLGIGSVIDGRYAIESVLGEGGFGIVYRAKQTSTGQSVAVKLLHAAKIAHSAEGAAEAARFEREMKLIAQLKHPNIVRLIDSGYLQGGQLYTVLEFIEGEELNKLLKREGAMKPAVAKSLFFQVLDALSAAHRHGVVHRDLKPQNIMVTTTGVRRNAMVLDFGISAIVEEARGDDYQTLTMAGRIHGTPAYMAPEQLRSKTPSPQTDIYAWGLVFLEALTGRRAVNGETLADIIAAQVSVAPVVIPDEIIRHPLGQILARATAKHLDQRFLDAEEALAALEACQFATDFAFSWTGKTIPEELTAMPSGSYGYLQSMQVGMSGQMPSYAGPGMVTTALPDGQGQAVHLSQPMAQLPAQVSGAFSGVYPASQQQQQSAARNKLLLLGVLALALLVAGALLLIILSKKESEPAADAAKQQAASATQARRDDEGPPQDTRPDPEDVEERYQAGEAYYVPHTKGAEMILIKGGTFEMGLARLDDMLLLCRDALGVHANFCNESLFAHLQPARKARVASFFVDRWEAKNMEYRQCVAEKGCRPIDRSVCALTTARGSLEIQDLSAQHLEALEALLGGDELAVTCINQAEALAFCQWAGKRLPTEEEWEYVASAGGTRLFPWGDQSEAGGARANGADLSLVNQMGWQPSPIAFRDGRENVDAYPFVAPVGSYPAGASPDGVWDLAGNVREWVAGSYRSYDGESDPTAATLRGGGWVDVGPWLSARYREKVPAQTRRSDTGVRCVLEREKVD